jgi:hypothetical protein
MPGGYKYSHMSKTVWRFKKEEKEKSGSLLMSSIYCLDFPFSNLMCLNLPTNKMMEIG